MTLTGKDASDKQKTIRFDIHAQHGDGLYIPCVPSILLTEQLCNQTLTQRGATACAGLISLQDYLETLDRLKLNIQHQTLLS